MLTLVAALANDNVIGNKNTLPWHLSGDLKHFKEVTSGRPVVMGRKTFDSIGHPLSGRLNVVVTRQLDWKVEGVVVVHSLQEALDALSNADEICIIGGAQLYEQALQLADKLRLTSISADIQGDAYFPIFDESEWLEVNRSAPQSENGLEYFFVDYERVKEL